MPLNNESSDEYLYKKAKAGGFDSPIKSKRIRTKTSFYSIDEQAIKDSDKPKKHKKRKVTEKHDLNDNSDEELDRLRSQYCTESKKMGNKKMKAIENDELQKKRIFINEEDLDSKDKEENKGLTCLECTEMKAMDDTLINGKEVQLQVSDGQRQLNETRRARNDKNVIMHCSK
jgi:hypothetical protein